MSCDREKLKEALKGVEPTSCRLCDLTLEADDWITVLLLGNAKYICHAACVSDRSDLKTTPPPEEIELGTAPTA